MSEPAESPQQALARLQAELAATQQQLTAAQTTLGDFAYAVSHELRANLRHISAYAALVREELDAAPDGGAASYLDTVSKAAKLMGQQIDGLLAWSQIDHASLELAPLDMRALLLEARASLAADMAGRQIEWRIAEDFPLVQGDAAMVREIWRHLLSNALKFTRPRAQAVIEIGWQPAPQAAQCLLFVQDNGVGFDPRGQDQLFRVFRRLHRAAEFEGLGLGLALTGKLVARQGGTVRAEGGPNVGCRIGFTLPLAPPGGSATAP